jgi:hypothetical protein
MPMSAFRTAHWMIMLQKKRFSMKISKGRTIRIVAVIKLVGTVPTTLFGLITSQKSIKFLQKSSKSKRIYVTTH